MGATNHTTNYSLSQFIGTDKPSWLNDYNSDMSNIDTAIHNAADAANNAATTATNASNAATTAQSTANSLNTQINTPSTGLAAVVSANTTDIGTITGTIGNSFPLDTTAQTLSGAINELAQGGGGGGSTPNTLLYLGKQTITKTYDGSLTYRQVFDSIYTDLVTLVSGLAAGEKIKVVSLNYNSPTMKHLMISEDLTLIDSVPTTVAFSNSVCTSGNVVVYNAGLASGSYMYTGTLTGNAYTFGNLVSEVGTSGNSAILTIEKYKVLS